jgi:hypothetical protein
LFLSYSKIKREIAAQNGFNVLLANGEGKRTKGKGIRESQSLILNPFSIIP